MEILANAPEDFAGSVATASDEELEIALRQLGQEQLIIAEAHSRGLAPTAEERDSIAREARNVILGWAETIGLVPGTGAEPGDGVTGADPEGADSGATPPPPPTAATAAERVEAALIRIISGQRQIVPLGGVTFLLRNQGSWRIHESRIEATVARIAEIVSP